MKYAIRKEKRSVNEVTVSTKYQVVIPKEVRRQAHIKPGEKFSVHLKGDIIALVPERPLQSLRGIAKGMDVRGLREKKDRR